MNDPTVEVRRVPWAVPVEQPVFLEPIPFVVPEEDHAHFRRLHHHHNPTVTWCDNGDLFTAWFNPRSKVGREMVIVASRLRRGAARWDKARLFFAPADRNTTGTTLFNNGQGRLYFFIGTALFAYYTANPDALPATYRDAATSDSVFLDFISACSRAVPAVAGASRGARWGCCSFSG